MTQYFDEDPTVTSDRRTVDVSLGDVAFTMSTDRGVFSHGHLDIGTSLLLREAAPPASTGHLADIGCGSGALALAMAMRSPAATVWAVDVNVRARRTHRTERSPQRCHERERCRAARCTCRRQVCNDLVESADPHRQAGSPRTVDRVARTARGRRGRNTRRAQASRRRLTPKMAEITGVRHRTHREQSRVSLVELPALIPVVAASAPSPSTDRPPNVTINRRW